MIYCSSCGQKAEYSMKYCPSCGARLENNVFCLDDLSTPPDDTGPRAGIIAVQIHDGKETVEKTEPVYYSDERGICLTPSVLVVPGKNQESPSTYSLDNITSVKSETDISARIIGIVGMVFGLVILLAKDYISLGAGMVIGIVLIVLGVLIAVFVRPTYHLKIAGSHGEADVLKMSRKQEFDRILAALQQALAQRG